jgi:hypothetical protein
MRTSVIGQLALIAAAVFGAWNIICQGISIGGYTGTRIAPVPQQRCLR